LRTSLDANRYFEVSRFLSSMGAYRAALIARNAAISKVLASPSSVASKTYIACVLEGGDERDLHDVVTASGLPQASVEAASEFLARLNVGSSPDSPWQRSLPRAFVELIQGKEVDLIGPGELSLEHLGGATRDRVIASIKRLEVPGGAAGRVLYLNSLMSGVIERRARSSNQNYCRHVVVSSDTNR
jgi:hypothetical protein